MMASSKAGASRPVQRLPPPLVRNSKNSGNNLSGLIRCWMKVQRNSLYACLACNVALPSITHESQ